MTFEIGRWDREAGRGFAWDDGRGEQIALLSVDRLAFGRGRVASGHIFRGTDEKQIIIGGDFATKKKFTGRPFFLYSLLN